MNHLFVDVEALRLKQPWMAPLMQVGMVVFTEEAVVVSQSSKFVHPATIPQSFVVDMETLNWWKQQEAWPMMVRSREAGQGVSEVISSIYETFHNFGCQSVWFSGPTYDQVMLEAYFDKLGLPCPWKHNQTRDFRTIRKQHPNIEYIYAEGCQLHDAMYDSLASVAHLRKITLATGAIWK